MYTERGTELQAAVMPGNIDLVGLLLDEGADPDHLSTALHEAANYDNINIVRLLLDAGAEVNYKYTYPAIATAASRSHDEIVQPLLDVGQDRRSLTFALEAATERCSLKLVKLLLNAGASTGIALGEAALRGNIELLRFLLDSGADVNAPAAYSDTATPIRATQQEYTEIVRMLLETGADVNAPAKGTWVKTALQEAAAKRNVELVRILLDADANVNAPAGKYRETALQSVTKNQNIELVRILLDSGADANAPRQIDIMQEKEKELHCRMRHKEIVLNLVRSF
jgi:ankyrin repeat protein